MRSFVTKITGAAAVLAGAAAAQEFRVVGSVYNGVPGEIYTYRTWYGDGNLYVGPHIPASVQTALNFTSKLDSHLCSPDEDNEVDLVMCDKSPTGPVPPPTSLSVPCLPPRSMISPRAPSSPSTTRRVPPTPSSSPTTPRPWAPTTSPSGSDTAPSSCLRTRPALLTPRRTFISRRRSSLGPRSLPGGPLDSPRMVFRLST